MKFNKNTIRLLSIVIVVVGYFTMKSYWGSDTIGSIFSRNTYNVKYYAHLFPENSTAKNYVLPAYLHVDGDNLYLLKVEWPNGGFTTFERFGDMEPQMFFYDRRMKVTDDEGRNWIVILAKKIK